MKIFIFLFLILIGGCSSNKIQEKTDLVVEDKFKNIVYFPSDIDLEECQEFPIFDGKNSADLYKFVVDSSKIYYECSNKAKLSQDFIKKVYKK